ncbi:hypothetical protein NBRC110019_07760 [Neptunitalea chrysea]|uniref:DUF3164 family protein n=1 Tax=Neptunitalea chrysea TaxID=1647581 RepID=A0A9W6B4K9_9FLAO|nr:DUF3164 family protein [Neptunitalea chrysea]GLB51737.1 hypothetical protein NBRC110019_07760 [Neptunitalea chrysea]
MSTLNGFTEAELAAALREKRAEREKDRKAYKELVYQTVPALIDTIAEATAKLMEVKKNVYTQLQSILEMKYEVYGVKEEQQTHTFSDAKGRSVTIGYNIVDNWDDTVNSGIAKINQYIQSLASKDADAETITIINQLLKRDAKGNLKSSRVLELISLADKLNNETFTDGIQIIKDSYAPNRTSFFIKANTVDKDGNKMELPLNISSVPFPEEFDVSFLIPEKDGKA